MNDFFCHANSITPTPNITWRNLSDEMRLTQACAALKTNMPAVAHIVEIVMAKKDGQIIARLVEDVGADKRGSLLLDLEAMLKQSIDPALVVWLESLNDRSSLRNLRGIGVKA